MYDTVLTCIVFKIIYISVFIELNCTAVLQTCIKKITPLHGDIIILIIIKKFKQTSGLLMHAYTNFKNTYNETHERFYMFSILDADSLYTCISIH